MVTSITKFKQTFNTGIECTGFDPAIKNLMAWERRGLYTKYCKLPVRVWRTLVVKDL